MMMYSFAQTIFVRSWPWMKMVLHSLRVLPFHFIVQQQQQHQVLPLIHYSKRTLFSSRRNTIISRQQQAPTKTTCWFRITRLAVESPPKTTPAVREYLRAWSKSSQQANVTKLLQQAANCSTRSYWLSFQ